MEVGEEEEEEEVENRPVSPKCMMTGRKMCDQTNSLSRSLKSSFPENRVDKSTLQQEKSNLRREEEERERAGGREGGREGEREIPLFPVAKF